MDRMGVRTHVLIKYSSDKMALDEAILRLNENTQQLGAAGRDA